MFASRYMANLWVLYYLQTLLRNYPFTAEKIEAIHRDRIPRLARHAYSIPFYKARFDGAGVNPESVRTVVDLMRLPPLTKEEYRSWVQKETSNNPSKYSSWWRDGTSGSTGTPLTIYRPWKERAYLTAKWLREHVINGYRPPFDTTFCLISPHRLRKSDSILQAMGLLRRETLSYLAEPREMIDKLNQVKPDLFYANKSQFVQMALYAEENSLHLFQPRQYACGAETMDEISKRLIKKHFGESGFYETYGCVELGILGFQLCGRDDRFVFCHDTNVLHVVDEVGNSTFCGQAQVTDLYQYAFPLINYRIGDNLSTFNDQGISYIQRINGRSDDWVVFTDGTRIPFHTFYEVMEKRGEIAQFRIVQEDLLNLVVQVVRHPNTSRNEAQCEIAIVDELKSHLRGKDITITVKWESRLDADPSGKLRMLVSKVPQADFLHRVAMR